MNSKQPKYAKQTPRDKTPRSQFPLRLGEMIGAGGGELQRRWPDHSIAALARPGMMVSTPDECDLIIVQVTPDFCICESAAGQRHVERWHAVTIERVEPQPQAMLTGAADPFYAIACDLELLRDRIDAQLHKFNEADVGDARARVRSAIGDGISAMCDLSNDLRLVWLAGKLKRKPSDGRRIVAA